MVDAGDDKVSVNADGTVTVDYDWSESRPVSIAVLEALEVSTGRGPETFGPLNDIIDVDALDNLFTPTASGEGRGPGYVTFEIEDHSATVHSDGSVVLAPRN